MLGHDVGQPRMKTGHLPGPPLEPLLPQGPLHERRPPGKAFAECHRLLTANLRKKPRERCVVEPEGRPWQVHPAVMRQHHRQAIDGLGATDPHRQFAHDIFHGLLHPWIEHVVVAAAAAIGLFWLAITAHTGDARRLRSTAGEDRLERRQRGIEGDRWHEPQALAGMDAAEHAEQILADRIEARVGCDSAVPTRSTPRQPRRPDRGTVAIDDHHRSRSPLRRKPLSRMGAAGKKRLPVGKGPTRSAGRPLQRTKLKEVGSR